MKKISIIIPVYNMAHYLEQCLESVVNQTLSEIEIICIDDCSTDNSHEILEQYAAKDNRFKILKQNFNQGTGKARNWAINVAQGEYIMFVDPDDWLALDACEKAYNYITKYDNDIVFFNYYKFNDTTNAISFQKKYVNDLQKISDIGNVNVRENDVPYNGFAWSKIYKKDFLILNNCIFAPGRAAEDCPFAAITTIKAKSISALNEPIYYYRYAIKNKNRDRVIRKRITNYYEVFDSRRFAYDIVNNEPEAGRFRNIFNAFYINKTISSYKFYSSKDKSISATLYQKVRKDFLNLVNENDIDEIRNLINYFEFEKFLKYKHYRIYKLSPIFFSFKHIDIILRASI